VSTPNRNDGAEWVTLREAAEITGRSVKTARRWATEGKVLAQKDERGRWFVRRQDLETIEPSAKTRADLLQVTEQLAATMETFHGLAADLAAASERAGRAEGERDALAAEVERLKAELDRRWWQRRRTR